jgi:leader peptidase (prepilin peptidase) / N-methyltransferase
MGDLFPSELSLPHVLYLRDLIVDHPWLMAFWVFVVGSAIGSFLNVVVYRLPRALSISNPPSHCPRCDHAIRWYHNLPVVGWLVLGGKCLDCRAPISPRYPLVELAAGLLFVALGWLDVHSAAVDASATGNADREFLTALVEFAGHAWIASTLLAAGLIWWDGFRVPSWLILPAIGVSVLLVPFVTHERRWWLIGAAVALVATLIARPNRG